MRHEQVTDDGIDPKHWLPPDEDVLTEARKHIGDVVIREGDRGGREYQAFDRPLTLYAIHGHITDRQFRAGRRLYILWRNSALRVRYVRSSYGVVTGGDDTFNPQCIPREYLAAMAAISGERQRQMVYDVCCLEYKAGKRGGMRFLKAGLDDLVAWWRIDERNR